MALLRYRLAEGVTLRKIYRFRRDCGIRGKAVGWSDLSQRFLWLSGGNSRFLGIAAAGEQKIFSFSPPRAMRNLDRGRALIIISLDMNVPLRVGSDWPVRNASPWSSLEGAGSKAKAASAERNFLGGDQEKYNL